MTQRPADWSPPSPRELPALREHLAEYVTTWPAHLFVAEALRHGRGTLRPMASPAVGAGLLLEDEHRRLSGAQLFYVTADITRLVRQAAPSLRDKWDIQPQDLPAPTGFMLFAEPMAEYVREDGKRIDVVAVSWGGTELVTSETGGLWVTFWTVTDFAAIKRLARAAGASAVEAELAAHQQNAELTWDNELYLPWGSTFVTVAPGEGGRVIDPTSIAAAETTLSWLQTVHAGWIFSNPNNLTETTEEHLPRTQRIRAERAGHRASPVRVVSISRKPSSRSVRQGDPSGRTVSVQFPVAPFFRRQPYGPGSQLRKLIPIAGHWRGPLDAPVRITQKVNVVDTAPTPDSR
ncbi:hypothetical protein [Amycolatopsis sp. SID8362]|uniref:hypothetical protein n=1 Tax=Amycolatopsis sp. SID8362 TaxID=2690346 RepID=UPI00136E0C26|nr:hypothetical protein [Amycolatopsis sp. SID8362]NBH06040.1 hypothetical protein [Amycolatopsis sp. SID8362]NED42739.1 hypothetical protein [Amycolatopsis sp. SID8362]